MAPEAWRRRRERGTKKEGRRKRDGEGGTEKEGQRKRGEEGGRQGWEGGKYRYMEKGRRREG